LLFMAKLSFREVCDKKTSVIHDKRKLTLRLTWPKYYEQPDSREIGRACFGSERLLHVENAGHKLHILPSRMIE